MKVIVAGSRSITSRRTVTEVIERSGFTMTEMVNGMCPKGVDRVALDYARDYGKPVREFPADWKTYPTAAGRMRNVQMAQYADALIAVWDGKSTGTKHMMDTARRMGLKVYVEIAA